MSRYRCKKCGVSVAEEHLHWRGPSESPRHVKGNGRGRFFYCGPVTATEEEK